MWLCREACVWWADIKLQEAHLEAAEGVLHGLGSSSAGLTVMVPKCSSSLCFNLYKQLQTCIYC